MEIEQLKEFDFELDSSKIAKYPRPNSTQLLIFDQAKQQIKLESKFSHIISYLKKGDILVCNDARVSKRKVFLLHKQQYFEVLFLENTQINTWQCLVRKSKKLKIDSVLSTFDKKFSLTVTNKKEEFCYLTADKKLEESFFDFYGNIPLPPYMKRNAEKFDNVFYQTIFSKTPNSLASPTAGLHFSQKLVSDMEKIGISFLYVTLEVGYGTFKPLREENFIYQKLHKEKISISAQTAQSLNYARKRKNRIIAVGTTTLRVLESSFNKTLGAFEEIEGETDIFITPEQRILSSDGLITNFHLPQSSLMLLVSAFCGRENLLKCYRTALDSNFLFYSYGDAMLLIK